MVTLNLFAQSHTSFFPRLATTCIPVVRKISVACMAISHSPVLKSTQICEPTIVRRTANYHPCIWDYDFIQSLTSDYKGDIYQGRLKKLTEKVNNMLHDEDMNLLARLELVDSLQRLGLGYLFEKEIKGVLANIATESNNLSSEDGLHHIALHFRLLRQHGYEISQDVFDDFMNETGTFRESLRGDTKGMLSLYEASYLAFEGENKLDEAKTFTIMHLKNIEKSVDLKHAKQASHSLEVPLHLRILRLEARWYIAECTTNKHGIHPDLLDLARLDFNMVQATHQNDLKEISRWWRSVGLGSKLSFARDRSVENFFWTIGVIPHPNFGPCRKGLAKVNVFITTIDDVYDVYGSLDELKLFTDAVERWEIGTIEQLPDYMKLCFLALYNTINEMAYDTLKEQGWNSIPYLRKAWADLCRAYLVEAIWYHNRYTPTFQEYLNNAWISSSGPVILVHAYFLVEKKIEKEGVDCLESYPDIVQWSSMLLRLYNDLGTSTDELERGDVPKAIQCYMHETGVSEEIAREYIKHLIDEMWKKMNKDRLLDYPFSHMFLTTTENLARMARCTYDCGDGHGVSNGTTKDRVLELLVDQISCMHVE